MTKVVVDRNRAIVPRISTPSPSALLLFLALLSSSRLASALATSTIAATSSPSSHPDSKNMQEPRSTEGSCGADTDSLLSCDYLVVGGGAMGLAFVDSLLLLQPEASIIVVDKHTAPGGHWNDDYDYVALHQPSLVYGVQSSQLEGNWLKLLLKGQIPPMHRANKEEILRYYREVVDKYDASGQLQYFANSFSDLEQTAEVAEDEDGATIHSFVSSAPVGDSTDVGPSCAETEAAASVRHRVRVKVMVVDAVQGEVKIPATTPPHFAVEDSSIQVVNPNELHQMHQKAQTQVDSNVVSGSYKWTFGGWLFRRVRNWFSSSHEVPSTAAATTYVVLGCGKTGMDAIVYLINGLKVNPEHVVWVISRDVWVINRLRGGPSVYHQELLKQGGEHEATMDALEAKQLVYRLDPDVRPTAPFRFPTVSGSEIKTLRSITRKIRRGRVRSISVADDNQHPRLVFEDGSDLVLNDALVGDTVFVHCTAPGPFNGHKVDSIYSEVAGTSLKMTLFPILPPPVPLSGAMLARIETSRRNGTVDLELGHAILQARKQPTLDPTTSSSSVCTGAAIWKELIRPYFVGSPDSKGHLDVHWNLATFLALLDKDPTVGANWLSKGNRLSIYTWVEKLRAFENVRLMMDQAKPVGYSEGEVRALQLLADKLAPLQGR